MKQKWSIREYREGDEEGILELWKAVNPLRQYNREQWMKWWHWMYKENPAASGKIWIWLADDDSRIVGQYAVMPVVMKIAGKTIIGAQSLDTMTHPEYTRRGIFETLTNKVYREAETEGIHIVYGFPNKLSYPGFTKKLKWFDVATMQIMFKPLNWENTLKIRVKNKFLLKLFAIGAHLVSKGFVRTQSPPVVEGLTITQVFSFDDRINDFWGKVSNRYKIIVIRNRAYLNWRYGAPNAKYIIYIAEGNKEIFGYLVLRCLQREYTKVGLIFDILAQSEEVARYLLLEAVERCKREKMHLIQCNLIADKMLLKAFRKSGFLPLPFIKGSQFCAYSSSSDISKEFLKDPQNWLVQIGDSDLV